MAELGVLKKVFDRVPSAEAVLESLKNGKTPVALNGLSATAAAVFVSAAAYKLKRPALVIVRDDADALRVSADINSSGTKALLFPSRDVTFAKSAGSSKEYEHKRTDTLSKIIEGDFGVVVASAEAVLQPVASNDSFSSGVFTLTLGEEINPDTLCSRLTKIGYTLTEQVDGSGTFARRGGIIDLFCTDMADPCRIEFFGDEIDSISLFDTDTQRRTDSIDAIKITPASEIADNSERLASLLEEYSEAHRLTDAQQKTIRADIDLIRAGVSVPFDRYLSAVYEEGCTVLDYLKQADIFFIDHTAILSRLNSLEEYFSETVQSALSAGHYFEGLSTPIPSAEALNSLTRNRNTVYLDNFISAREGNIPTYTLTTHRLGMFGGDVGQLKEDISPTLNKNGRVIIITANKRAADSLILSLADAGVIAHFSEELKGIPNGGVSVTVGALSSGFEVADAGISIISACREKGTSKKRKQVKRDPNAKEITSLEELSIGDYVVHSSHGIGIFDGIHAIESGGITKDYIKIKYAGTDVLYVPVTGLDLVSKYIGSSEDMKIKLNRLSSNDWQNTRKRVRAAVKDIAKQLVELYAKRMTAKGYAYSPDTDMQNDFERRFAFDETEDQLRCIKEIKDDMEKPTPMDRLLCGDVGFGKTEVALRAAFKALSEGKQVAMLVPTTILAWQHLNTIKSRFSHFPIEVKMLSRFSTPAENRKTVAGLKTGRVDMVVGTHRLISSDVEFHDLGLVIIDEEQRFGVAQKEKLKEKHPEVDVLTLSATPIPRTLNMALSGLRDMSGIDEAPSDRQPVQTYILEQNNSVIFEAINRELRRDGQVYYLHNRVDSIEKTALRLKSAFPDAEIGIAHGKMDEETLSDIWRRLIEHEIDILVCTTIIETGVDVPNANTLIIEDADRMGLSQLHQLRGRVGRSPRRAYAYFCYKPFKSISEVATKRLDAMREYTEFGSGFRIAMRDLEIRGAGSVLGAKQHGHLESVGYDMYMRMLKNAIDEQNGKVKQVSENECTVDIDIAAHLPEEYIPALSQRLGMYRRIASITTKEDISDVIDELCDRFGEPPAPVMGLIDIAYLRSVAASLGITEIRQQNGMLLLFVKEISPDIVSKMAAEFGRDFYLSAGNRPYFSVKPKATEPVIKTLEKITEVLKQ